MLYNTNLNSEIKDILNLLDDLLDHDDLELATTEHGDSTYISDTNGMSEEFDSFYDNLKITLENLLAGKSFPEIDEIIDIFKEETFGAYTIKKINENNHYEFITHKGIISIMV